MVLLIQLASLIKTTIYTMCQLIVSLTALYAAIYEKEIMSCNQSCLHI